MTHIPPADALPPQYSHAVFEAPASPGDYPVNFAIITAYNPNGKMIDAEHNETTTGRFAQLKLL